MNSISFLHELPCSIRVNERYRNSGIGTELFKACFKFLETDKPVITISEKNIPIFKKHIDKYKFEQKQILDDYYIKGSKEYVYNGTLV